jgi:hypothetical protein
MKRKQTVVFPPKLDEEIFHAYVIKSDDEWMSYKLCYIPGEDKLEQFMKDNFDACISKYGWPVSHGQFHVYLTSYLKKKVSRKDFMKAQEIDEPTMKWLENPVNLADLISVYGTEPPSKAPKRDCRTAGMWMNGYANKLDEINNNMKRAIDDILGHRVNLSHMIKLETEDRNRFL